jgi:hypothetical protein
LRASLFKTRSGAGGGHSASGSDFALLEASRAKSNVTSEKLSRLLQFLHDPPFALHLSASDAFPDCQVRSVFGEK